MKSLLLLAAFTLFNMSAARAETLLCRATSSRTNGYVELTAGKLGIAGVDHSFLGMSASDKSVRIYAGENAHGLYSRFEVFKDLSTGLHELAWKDVNDTLLDTLQCKKATP